MSYDIYIHRNGELILIIGNYTSNVGAMYGAASDGAWHDETRVPRYKDFPTREFLPIGRQIVTIMARDPERFESMDPENGWGDYDGALAYMVRIVTACEDFPEDMLYISS